MFKTIDEALNFIESQRDRNVLLKDSGNYKKVSSTTIDLKMLFM